jgi:glycosyltransferase involved in cell wall biosynthesis
LRGVREATMNTEKKTLISLVVPVYNEEENVRTLRDRAVKIMAGLPRYDYEILFTDNHSTDATFRLLEELAASDPRVRAIRFSRNFGYQRSILTGYLRSKGAAVIQLDCDLQDPPELIPRFLELWEAGNQVVYGIRRSRREAWWINAARAIFYRLIDSLSEDDLPHDAGDFRLVDRRVIDELALIDDSQPYLRGALATLGFNQIGVPYDRAERERGTSKFSLRDLTGLAVDGILNHSIVPLRVATYTGLTISFLTFLGLVFCASAKLFFGRSWPAGFATTTILILLSLTLNAIFFGIIGEYLGRIYKQVRRKPMTIIEREIGARSDEKAVKLGIIT